MKHLKNISTLVLCTLAVGCSTIGKEQLDTYLIDKSIKKASFEFDCPAEKITVQQIDSRSFGVKGCGYRSTYVLIDSNCKADNMLGEKHLDKFCQLISDTAYGKE